MRLAVFDEFMRDFFFKGDPRCPLKIGDKIIKIAKEDGDVTPVGTPGIVRGSHYRGNDFYLVQFDGASEEELVLIVGWKITKR